MDNSKIRIINDDRPLSGFYPDPHERHQIHYGFAHQFLPWYVHQNPRAFFNDFDRPEHDVELFVRTRFPMFEQMCKVREREDFFATGQMTFRRVMDLTARRERVLGRPAILVQMPRPAVCPDAFYVLAVLEPAREAASGGSETAARVFTLERDASEEDFGPDRPLTRGVVGEWTPEPRHCNYGVIRSTDAAAFIACIERLLAKPAAPSASMSPAGPDGNTTINISFP